MNNYDGLAILKKFRLKDTRRKVIMLTTNDKMSIFEECIQLGAITFISKPFCLSDILSLIAFVSENDPLELSC